MCHAAAEVDAAMQLCTWNIFRVGKGWTLYTDTNVVLSIYQVMSLL
jgi:hypothetical protein